MEACCEARDTHVINEAGKHGKLHKKQIM